MTDPISLARRRLEKKVREWDGFAGITAMRADVELLLAHDAQMTKERDAVVREMHLRELHHFETEQLLAKGDQ